LFFVFAIGWPIMAVAGVERDMSGQCSRSGGASVTARIDRPDIKTGRSQDVHE